VVTVAVGAGIEWLNPTGAPTMTSPVGRMLLLPPARQLRPSVGRTVPPKRFLSHSGWHEWGRTEPSLPYGARHEPNGLLGVGGSDLGRVIRHPASPTPRLWAHALGLCGLGTATGPSATSRALSAVEHQFIDPLRPPVD
jgi:hypothetical protein